MGTEKFIAFKEDGTAYRLKGRILRFLDNEPVSEADKTNIRSTLSVPASAEGLTPANNLSDLDSAATARTNLSVNSKDEDAQANGAKVTAPALYFNGSSYVTVADDDKFSFTDGSNPTGFGFGGWVNLDPTWSGDGSIVSKDDGTNREWRLGFDENGANDSLRVILFDSGGSTNYSTYTALVGGDLLPGQWQHIFFTYDPDTGDGVLYQNGVALSTAKADTGSGFANFSNTIAPVRIGIAASNVYFKGSIRDCKIFNRTLTASEVAELARGNDLGYSEEWGGALGGIYTQDSTPSGEWSSNAGADADEAGPIGGKSNVLKFTTDNTSNQHFIFQATSGTTKGKRYRANGNVYIPSGQSNIDGIRLRDASIGDYTDLASPTLDAWVPISLEYLASSDNHQIRFYALDGGVVSFQDAGGDDVFYLADCTITEIGTLADFRSEDYNESASKLLDRSSNNFVGVGTSVTLTGNQRHISADTIDLKNLPTSSAGLSAGEVWSNGGVLTVV